MSRKKSIVVEYDLSRWGWSIKLQGRDSDARTEIIEAVEAAAKRHDITLVNAKPAFGEQSPKKERKKITKIDSATKILKTAAERSEQADSARQAEVAREHLSR